ncbi:MAG: lipid-A-disaccharide synthase [Bacteroidales bacterium]|nr:lipid-A-disaccharide synthase [Bacteroidales bacterium]
MKYYIIAGEASGDLHGSNLMKGLYAKDPEADIRFWGGALMNAVAKANRPEADAMAHDYNEGAVMGYSQVILKAGTLLCNIRRCKEDISAWNPDVVILIDYPGFNLKIAKYAHEKGFKVFWYIAPKVWASREGRIKKIKKYVDRLYIIFPFEIEYFEKKEIPFTYAGNPLIDAIDGDSPTTREQFLRDAGLEDRPIIALLAGSRRNEVSLTMPVLEDVVKKMKATPEYADYQFVVAGAPSRKPEDYITKNPSGEIRIVFGKTHDILRYARAAVVNSGTASLEAALIGTPQVVVYKMSKLTFEIAKRIICIDTISLANLIAGRKIFREFVQYDCNPEKISEELVRLTGDEAYRAAMAEDYALVRKLLGGSGASQAVATAMIKELTSAKKS